MVTSLTRVLLSDWPILRPMDEVLCRLENRVRRAKFLLKCPKNPKKLRKKHFQEVGHGSQQNDLTRMKIKYS